MSVHEALLKAYYTTISGLGYACYQEFAVPENVNYPFVLISTIQVIQRQVKPCVQYECFVTVDIVTGSISPVGNLQAVGIAEDIDAAINDPETNIALASPWVIGNTYLQSSNNLSSRNDDSYIYRNIRTYRHLIGN